MFKKKKYIIVTLIFFTIIALLNSVVGKQNPSDMLKKADELFDSRQYLEAFKTYKKIYNEYQNYSPKMLLKMAMIKEEEGDVSTALFYINLYYDKTKEHDARLYMQRLGEQNHFLGYQINDEEYINYFLERYKKNIQLILCVLALLTVFFIAYSQLYKKTFSVASLMTFSVIIIGLLIITNTKNTYQHLVVKRSNVRMMDKPSSGASVIKKLSLGDRYKVVRKQDVWWEVVINDDKTGFVREQNVIAPNIIY